MTDGKMWMTKCGWENEDRRMGKRGWENEDGKTRMGKC